MSISQENKCTLKEIEAYAGLLLRLKDDGFKALSIQNEGLSKSEFLKQIGSLLNEK